MFMGVARRVHRLTGSKMSGRPLLYLTTVGAKSGQPRITRERPAFAGYEQKTDREIPVVRLVAR
jgi:hypothetical protein